jgi:hypothetical protein
MTGSTGGRVRYLMTGVIIAIVAAVTWIVGQAAVTTQAASIQAADGPVEFGAPLMTLPEMAAVALMIALAAVPLFVYSRVVPEGSE